MLVTVSNFFRRVRMTLTDDQVSRLDDSRPFTDILSAEQKEALCKVFPKDSHNGLIIHKAGDGFASILWTYRPLPSYNSHVV